MRNFPLQPAPDAYVVGQRADAKYIEGVAAHSVSGDSPRFAGSEGDMVVNPGRLASAKRLPVHHRRRDHRGLSTAFAAAIQAATAASESVANATTVEHHFNSTGRQRLFSCCSDRECPRELEQDDVAREAARVLSVWKCSGTENDDGSQSCSSTNSVNWYASTASPRSVDALNVQDRDVISSDNFLYSRSRNRADAEAHAELMQNLAFPRQNAEFDMDPICRPVPERVHRGQDVQSGSGVATEFIIHRDLHAESNGPPVAGRNSGHLAEHFSREAESTCRNSRQRGSGHYTGVVCNRGCRVDEAHDASGSKLRYASDQNESTVLAGNKVVNNLEGQVAELSQRLIDVERHLHEVVQLLNKTPGKHSPQDSAGGTGETTSVCVPGKFLAKPMCLQTERNCAQIETNKCLLEGTRDPELDPLPFGKVLFRVKPSGRQDEDEWNFSPAGSELAAPSRPHDSKAPFLTSSLSLLPEASISETPLYRCNSSYVKLANLSPMPAVEGTTARLSCWYPCSCDGANEKSI